MWSKIKSIFLKNGESIFQGKCILLVDDGEVDRHFVTRVLEERGYKVLCAENGKIGLYIAENERPDLILLDCIMPGLSGPEVGKQLKEKEKTKDIPIIFLTSLDTPANIVDCYDLGAVHFLAKPVNAKILIKQIETVLKELKGFVAG